ncbi:hypothetical protein ACP275_05G084700 [Erythranthe tilingii]
MRLIGAHSYIIGSWHQHVCSLHVRTCNSPVSLQHCVVKQTSTIGPNEPCFTPPPTLVISDFHYDHAPPQYNGRLDECLFYVQIIQQKERELAKSERELAAREREK